MKIIIGLLMIACGVGLGVYVGGYICLYGSIVTVIEQIALVIKGGSVVASALAWAIVKFFCAGLAGFGSASVLIIPGAAILSDE